jgi:hypothetical protein
VRSTIELSIEAQAVRARCERIFVERCQMTFGRTGDFGSIMPILSVGVRWSRAIGRVCKPEVAGSSPARSMTRTGGFAGLLSQRCHHRQQRCERGASGGTWDRTNQVVSEYARPNVRQYFGPALRVDFGSVALASLRLTSGRLRREHAGPSGCIDHPLRRLGAGVADRRAFYGSDQSRRRSAP